MGFEALWLESRQNISYIFTKTYIYTSRISKVSKTSYSCKHIPAIFMEMARVILS